MLKIPMFLPTIPTIRQIETKSLLWTDISNVSPEEMKYLEEKFQFHPLYLAECLSPVQRPRIAINPNYIFMVLVFPIYSRHTRKIKPSEVDFFLGPNFLVTVHRNELPPLINFFNLCQISKSQQKKYFMGNPSALLYELLNQLLTHCNPILDNLNAHVASIEENIFRGYERRMVKEMLTIKSSITNFRRIMQIHRSVISKLIKESNLFFSPSQLKLYFEELIDTTEDIWEKLEYMQKTIETMETTNNSLISFQLNDIIKILTTISVIILPITLIANIFGMSIRFMPLADNPLAFWLIIGFMGLAFFLMVWYFKKKRWL